MKYPGLDKEFKVNNHPFWNRVEDGRWELPVIRKLIDIIRPTDIIFDVGAWIGVYTLLLSYLARKVIAFEPCPISRDILVYNLQLNDIDNVVVEPYALSNEESTEQLYFYNPILQELDEVVGLSMMNMVGREGSSESIPVQATTIDKYCKRNNIRPDGIKIDVEGYEGKVLEGCSQSCWKLVELHGKFARWPDIEGVFIDGNWNYGHLFVPAR